MLPLGLLLVLAAGTAGAAVVYADANGSAATLSAFGQSYDITTLGVFLLGTVVGVVGLAGFSLMVAGSQTRRDRRRSMKVEARSARTEAEQLAEENAQLRARVQDETVVDAGDPYPAEETTTRTGRHAFRK